MPPRTSKKNGFKAALDISPELKAFLGREKVSRPMLTKLMWAYFKQHKLMDPADKRFVKCDDKLKALTGEDRFQAFSFMKLLNRHIIKGDGSKAEEAEEEEMEAPAEEAGEEEAVEEAKPAEEPAQAPEAAPAEPAPAAPAEEAKPAEETKPAEAEAKPAEPEAAPAAAAPAEEAKPAEAAPEPAAA